MKRILITFCFLWIALVTVYATGSVTLAWNASCAPDVTGYVLYYGTNTTPATTPATNIVVAYTDECGVYHPTGTNIHHGYQHTVGSSEITVVVSNLVAGVTYYFAVTARNVLGMESDFSDEISYTVPFKGPKNVRIQIP